MSESSKDLAEEESFLTASRNLRVLEPGGCQVVEVRADDPWNASGIELIAGAGYTLKVETVEDWVDDGIPATPAEGWTSSWRRLAYRPFRFLARYPGANWYTLIGAIGKDPRHFFYIGQGVEFNAEVSGEFMCFANDKIDRYSNNQGRLTLKLRRNDS